MKSHLENVSVSISLIERLVLTIGVVLRLYLMVVNAEANDDHLTVIRIIADEHRLPRIGEAWEGFQPKLYHVIVATLWKLSPLDSLPVRIRLAQLVACAAGIGTLLVMRRAFDRRGVPAQVRLAALALVALNPTLIGLNAQATNDSLVIFFATAALAYGSDFFRTGHTSAFVAMGAAVVLSVLTKGNGLVVFVAVVATLVLAILHRDSVPGQSRAGIIRLGGAFVVVFVLSVAALGPYRANWQDTGDAFAINGPRAPRPHFRTATYVARPGVTSIVDAYLTFRLLDMLAHPAVTNEPYVYPPHRTSLWSQLYGRAHIAHFAQHPPSWRSTSGAVVVISRLILLFALVPTILLVTELLRHLFALLRRAFGGHHHDDHQLDADLLTLTALGFVAFVVVYSLTYRDFSTMKAEFMFPALTAYALFAAEGEERMASAFGRRVRIGLAGAFVALLALYVADALILAAQLT